MITPDHVNACFEGGSSLLGLLNIRQLLRDKAVKGFSPAPLAFFTMWGLWNLFYYPHMGQIWSFIGGCAIASENAIYLGLVLYYLRRSRRS